MNYLISSFIGIVRIASGEEVFCDEQTQIEQLFGDCFDELDFELVLCAFEATHKVAFKEKLADAALDDYGHMTVEEFLQTYLDPAEQTDPFFVARRFLMFRDAWESAMLPPPEEDEDEF